MFTLQSNSVQSHSRNSSSTSSISMPSTPTFSARTHHHWPSSGSSFTEASIMSKSQLDDLAEEVEDTEDAPYYPSIEPFDDYICMCDGPFCIHEPRQAQQTTTLSPSRSTEWCPGDDFMDLQTSGSKRRKPSDYSMTAFSNKVSRRFSSISRKWRDSQPTTSLSLQQRSATPPRSSSLRLPRLRSSLTNALNTPPRSDRSYSASSTHKEDSMTTAPLSITAPPTPIEEEPIDRQSMSRTPLLPPILNNFRSQSNHDVLRSPLQSPSVASSAIQSPATAPAMGIYTPPLSTSPSCASFHPFNHVDIPPMDLGIETDPWTIKLGHANFHIYPEPYVPELCTQDTCRRLLEDWETARTEYMRQAARISDDYGSNSHTYHLTEEKWSEIDAQWRANHRLVNETAELKGEMITFQPLAQTAPTKKMPTLSDDPNAPAKFPVINEDDIVGPMVQYAKIAGTSPTKKPGILRLFTDSASLLAKTPFHIRR